MRFPLLLSTALLTIACAVPAAAQTVLDRTDPTRVEERTPDTLAEQRDSAVPVTRQSAAPVPVATGFAVGAVAIDGLEVLSQAAFTDVVEPYLGRVLDPDGLAELADRLAARARQTFPLASAAIEPQEVRAGVLRVRVDEGRVDEVRLEGADNGAVLRSLEVLATGRPVAARQLERALLVAGDVDGIRLGEARILREAERNILVVEVREQPFRLWLALDNDSTKPLGPLELLGAARWSGVFGDADSLEVFGLVAAPQVEEIMFGRVRYARRISRAGTEMAVAGSLSRTRPGAYLSGLDIVGTSSLATVSLLHPVIRSRGSSLWLEGTFSLREVEQDRRDNLVRRDRLTTAELGWYGNARLAGGTIRVSGGVTRGLDMLGATRAGDALASRDDADGTFTALALFADWTRPISGLFGMRLAVRSQFAGEPLLVVEEIGLGGAAFVRGYDYRERSGDQGAMAYGELHYAFKSIAGLNALEVYSFADGGEVTNLAGGFGGGTLFSTGAGMRLDMDRRTDAGLEVAVPLSGERYDTGDATPRVRFSVTRHF